MRISYSRVSIWTQCPRRFKLRYIDDAEREVDSDPTAPLITGTLLHRAVETDIDTAAREYYEKLPVASDESENEIIKVEVLAETVKRMLPVGRSEVEVSDGDFIGYIDRLGDDGSIWDLKYSDHPERYDGEQLQVYARHLEASTGIKATSLHYLVVPRIHIRLKKSETLDEFRQRLRSLAREVYPIVIDVERDESAVDRFEQRCEQILADDQYPKHQSELCKWCEFKQICLLDGENMQLPENKRRDTTAVSKKKIWLYGAPFSGKTYLADKFPNVLMLNTDGNIGFVGAPYVAIHDEVTMNGRIASRKLAWDVFKEAIEELEKKQNSYETIVVDLLEDLYESCRLWSYAKLGIEHESDNSFKAYDFVRTQFLSTIKRLINLDYANIVLISQEDMSRDITKRSGDKVTTIRPNLQERVAVKVAGMVDIVGRLVVEDGERAIMLKPSEVVFGGGRIPIKNAKINATYEAICSLYERK